MWPPAPCECFELRIAYLFFLDAFNCNWLSYQLQQLILSLVLLSSTCPTHQQHWQKYPWRPEMHTVKATLWLNHICSTHCKEQEYHHAEYSSLPSDDLLTISWIRSGFNWNKKGRIFIFLSQAHRLICLFWVCCCWLQYYFRFLNYRLRRLL